eukprot:8612437-Lingulodinium_polyedra.AAC.1
MRGLRRGAATRQFRATECPGAQPARLAGRPCWWSRGPGRAWCGPHLSQPSARCTRCRRRC